VVEWATEVQPVEKSLLLDLRVEVEAGQLLHGRPLDMVAGGWESSGPWLHVLLLQDWRHNGAIALPLDVEHTVLVSALFFLD
jgi:hypothetical protein